MSIKNCIWTKSCEKSKIKDPRFAHFIQLYSIKNSTTSFFRLLFTSNLTDYVRTFFCFFYWCCELRVCHMVTNDFFVWFFSISEISYQLFSKSKQDSKYTLYGIETIFYSFSLFLTQPNKTGICVSNCTVYSVWMNQTNKKYATIKQSDTLTNVDSVFIRFEFTCSFNWRSFYRRRTSIIHSLNQINWNYSTFSLYVEQSEQVIVKWSIRLPKERKKRKVKWLNRLAQRSRLKYVIEKSLILIHQM